MFLLSWLLWSLVPCAPGGPVHRSPPSEQDAAPRPSFHRLPVFVQAPGPLVAPERLRPGPHRRVLDAELTALLLPPPRPRVPVRGAAGRAVEVWCGTHTVSVRLDRAALRAWSDPDRFRLGSCGAWRVTPRFIYFHRSLEECGGELQVDGGQLVLTIPLLYVPPQQGLVIRVPPLHLSIHCHYNRFHYSYKVGFRPLVQHAVFLKSLERKLAFSLTVHNERWEPLPAGHGVFLGEQLYFMAQTGPLSDGERLYVDSCYASSSTEPSSVPRVELIANYGCMSDSRREGSSSRFLQRGNNVLRFSVDVFLFRTESQVQYLHCSMSVGWTASQSSKSCNYNKAASRWEELEEQGSSPSVCSCCDSVCGDILPTLNTVSSPGWFIEHEDEVKVRKRMRPVHAEDTREEPNLTVKMTEDSHVKDQSSQWKKKTHRQDHKGEFLAKKNSWRLSVSQQKTEEERWTQSDVPTGIDDSPTVSLTYEREKDGNAQTGETDPHDHAETDQRTADGPTSTLSAPGSSLGLGHNKSSPAVLTAVRPTDCLNGNSSCSSDRLVQSEKDGKNMKTAERFDHHHDTPGTSDPPSDRTVAGIQSDSGSAGLGSWSRPDQMKCMNESEDSRSDGMSADWLHVKGSGPLWFRDRVCGNGSDPRPAEEDGEALRLSQFPGPVSTPHTNVTSEAGHRRSAVVSLSHHEISSHTLNHTLQHRLLF